MGRVAWPTSLLPLLFPLISIAAAIALAPRWNALDPVETSIVERWLPVAAVLGAGAIVATSAHRDAARRRRLVVPVALLITALIAVLVAAIALVGTAGGHLRALLARRTTA